MRGCLLDTRIIVPARHSAPGAWPKNNTRDAGRRGNPGVGQIRAGSGPRGARGIDRASPPAGAVFLVAVSPAIPVLRLADSGL